LDLMPFFERTVQPYGVVLDEVHYYSDVLRRFVNAKEPGHPRTKRKFTFRRDPRNISTLYFYNPEVKDYFRIPYRDTAHPPMSIWEFREARRKLEKEGVKNINEALIFESYGQMRTIEDRARSETKRVRREEQRRRHHDQNHKPKTAIEKATKPSGAAWADSSGALPVIKPLDELEEL
jgi:putative transposase